MTLTSATQRGGQQSLVRSLRREPGRADTDQDADTRGR
jgi:hypothetical protein